VDCGSSQKMKHPMTSHNSASLDPVERGGPKGSIWPLAVVVFGLSLTVGWTIFLAYGLIMLVAHAL
jgi:hypothetical protein